MDSKKRVVQEEVKEVAKAPEIYVSPEMRQAIDVLIQAAEMGQKAGVYSLQDAVLIGQSANMLNPYRS